MPLSAYLERDTSETHSDVNLALSVVKQKLCQHFVRITIVGIERKEKPECSSPYRNHEGVN